MGSFSPAGTPPFSVCTRAANVRLSPRTAMDSLAVWLWRVRGEKNKTATGSSSAAFIVLAGCCAAARLFGCVRWLRPDASSRWPVSSLQLSPYPCRCSGVIGRSPRLCLPCSSVGKPADPLQEGRTWTNHSFLTPNFSGWSESWNGGWSLRWSSSLFQGRVTLPERASLLCEEQGLRFPPETKPRTRIIACEVPGEVLQDGRPACRARVRVNAALTWERMVTNTWFRRKRVSEKG